MKERTEVISCSQKGERKAEAQQRRICMSMFMSDVAILKAKGFSDEDVNQITYASKANVTRYEVDGKRITKSEAIGILGREKWLCGVGRSAFHRTATQVADDGTVVYFDSSVMFK